MTSFKIDDGNALKLPKFKNFPVNNHVKYNRNLFKNFKNIFSVLFFLEAKIKKFFFFLN